jgi:MbtH protein
METESRQYIVVINHEEQYALWPSHLAIPNGWRASGKSGVKEDCMAYVKEAWTDLTPYSVR